MSRNNPQITVPNDCKKNFTLTIVQLGGEKQSQYEKRNVKGEKQFTIESYLNRVVIASFLTLENIKIKTLIYVLIKNREFILK